MYNARYHTKVILINLFFSNTKQDKGYKVKRVTQYFGYKCVLRGCMSICVKLQLTDDLSGASESLQ